MRDNEINNIRPKSTFDTYAPQEGAQSQLEVKQAMLDLANNLIAASQGYYETGNPLQDGAFFILSSPPGRGKTHLMEALINHVSSAEPNMINYMFLLKRSFTTFTIASEISPLTFRDKPIIFIDDLFSQHQSVDTLKGATDIQKIGELISAAYDNRWLVVTTSNFPFLEGVLPKIAQNDTVGRVTSRCKEMLTARAGEFILDGRDYRDIIAENTKRDRDQRKRTTPTITFG